MPQQDKPFVFDQAAWSTVLIEPSLWWRIKALFKQQPIIFCWGQDRYITRGFKGEWLHSVGGVPTKIREELERNA